VRESYRTCRRLQRRHDPTYYVATTCLPRDVRPAVHALYGYVRGADEIVDGPRRLYGTPGERRAALDAWQDELERGLVTGRSDHPVIAALVDAGARHALPLHLLGRYMDSMRLDCGPVRIASRAQLDDYMEGSAATVGRIMAHLLGAPARREDVARLGVAFQLTNFIRDVPVDWLLDRVYLPGLPEDDLLTGRASDAFRATVAAEVDRARALFADTRDVAGAVRPAMAGGIRLARAVYARVLDRVEQNGFDVLGRPARLPAWQATRAAADGLLGARG
jgi:15-cis-phytoene synthase